MPTWVGLAWPPLDSGGSIDGIELLHYSGIPAYLGTIRDVWYQAKLGCAEWVASRKVGAIVRYLSEKGCRALQRYHVWAICCEGSCRYGFSGTVRAA